jgi:hypothetical protein
MEPLFDEIREVELKLQVCFEESNAQMEGNWSLVSSFIAISFLCISYNRLHFV